MDENTIEINWEDAPEGTTHYDTRRGYSDWKKYCEEKDIWHAFIGNHWNCFNRSSIVTAALVPKSEATPTVDSYTTPKEDPFTALLKQRLTSQDNLAEYLESIYDKVDQEGGLDAFLLKLDNPIEEQAADLLNSLYDTRASIEMGLRPLTVFGREEVEDILQKVSLNVSWYDYDKEELVGLPEKGEVVHDRHTQEDVEYLGKLHYEATVILEDRTGRCYDRCITHLKPLNYKDSPKRQARREQHKLLEDLVGDVDSNLQGYTHKGGAIKLYNKGWRVIKEGV